MDPPVNEEMMYMMWRSRTTLFQILQDRGYTIKNDFPEFKDFETWAKEFDNENLKKQMRFFHEQDSKKIIVDWPKEPKLGTNIRDIYTEMENIGVTNCILIISDSITPYTKNILKNLKQQNKIQIDVFTLKETQINITKHELVPKHEILSIPQKKTLLQEYNILPSQLPQIKLTDPVVRYFGAKKGQVMKITRKSETLEDMESISYRIVV